MKPLLLSCLLSFVVLFAAWPHETQAQNKPVAKNDAAMGLAGELLILDVLANDSDPDGDPLTITRITKAPAKGEATIGTTGARQVVLYRANASATGTDSFTYEIADGVDGTATATVTITFRSIKPPVAKDDNVTVFSHEVIEIDVLANDDDPDGDSLRIVDLPRPPTHGTASIVGESLLTYDPDPDFEGTDTLSYVIEDLDEATDTAFVSIEVRINRPPVAVNDSVTTLINASLEIDVLANDTDEEDDPLTVLGITATPAHGEAVLVANRRIRYTPDPGFLGTDALEYSLTDSVSRNGTLDAGRATVFLQVLPPSSRFEAVLSGTNEVPATRSRATGLIVASLNGNQLSFSGTFIRLESDFSEAIGANIYLGLAGETGEVLLPLTVRLSPGNRGGIISSEDNVFTLTSEELTALFERRMYVNIHSEALPDGATRGQLLPAEPTSVFRAVLSGRAQKPANRSEAFGGIVAERYENLVIVSGAFSGLESDFGAPAQPSGARLYRGDPGVNGTPLFDLTVEPGADERSGVLPPGANTFALTDAQVQLLEGGLLYINVLTEDRPGGEVRGQLLPLTTRIFEAFLTGDHEVPPLFLPGRGGMLALLDGSTLTLTGTFEGLDSPLDLNLRNGAHVHQGLPDENGDILFELAPVLDSGGRSGFFTGGNNRYTLSPERLDALFEGQLYVNIHTLDHPAGALRGQLLPSTNVAPGTAVVASPIDGAAIDLSGDPNASLEARWFPAGDVNGNVVYYRWQLALDTGFDRVIFEADAGTATQVETTAGAIVEALAAEGLAPADNVRAYHRVVSKDGSLATPGTAARVILGDGTATGVGEVADVPEHFAVSGNYPNPFNPSTTLQVDLPEPARVHVEVYDLLGRRVLTTPVRRLEAGTRRAVPVDASALTSGVYLYRVVARAAATSFTGTGRMTLVR